MIGIVSRLVEAKGLDLITHIMAELLNEDVQVVLLGTGNVKYENDFRWFNEHYDNFSGNIFFSPEMAKKIYATSGYIGIKIYVYCLSLQRRIYLHGFLIFTSLL